MKIAQRFIAGDKGIILSAVREADDRNGRGFFTDFKDGISQIPTKFVDYILYPDKERTEFTGGGTRLIQTNFRDAGWIFDGAAKTLKDQNAVQIEDFRLAMRTSVENLL